MLSRLVFIKLHLSSNRNILSFSLHQLDQIFFLKLSTQSSSCLVSSTEPSRSSFASVPSLLSHPNFSSCLTRSFRSFSDLSRQEMLASLSPTESEVSTSELFYSLVLEPDPSRAIRALEKVSSSDRLSWVSFRNQQGDARYQGQIPLHAAVRAGHVQLIRLLLESGSDPNAQTNNKSTPLTLSLQEGSSEITELLLDAGANPSAPNGLGYTPLQIASYKGDFQAVQKLLAAGATSKKWIDNRKTPP